MMSFNFKHKLIAGSTQGIIICIFKDLIFCSKSSIISLLPHFLPIIDFAIIEIGLYSSKSYENIFIEIFRFPPLLIKDFAKEYLFPPPINKIFTFQILIESNLKLIIIKSHSFYLLQISSYKHLIMKVYPIRYWKQLIMRFLY